MQHRELKDTNKSNQYNTSKAIRRHGQEAWEYEFILGNGTTQSTQQLDEYLNLYLNHEKITLDS